MTTTFGASASLSFNGTGVWIYGAKRSNHGPYNVTLDGTTYFDNGYYDGQVFQQILFSAVGLDGTTPHLVTIANSRVDAIRPYLDIDSVSALPLLVLEFEAEGSCGGADRIPDGTSR